MACVDADGLFLTIDVGDYGRNSDGRVFRRSSFGLALENNTLDIPEPIVLPGWEKKDKFPHYFVADEAFPLKTNIMRPFPKRSLNKERRIYNYRYKNYSWYYIILLYSLLTNIYIVYYSYYILYFYLQMF